MNNNLSIKNNFLITNTSLIAVFIIEPVDLFILPKVEQDIFLKDLHNAFNSMRNMKVQIITRTRQAYPSDLNRHFNSFLTKENKELNIQIELTSKYKKDLVELIKNNIIPIKDYYFVFRYAYRKSNNLSEFELTVNNFDRKLSKFLQNVINSGINARQLKEEELSKFIISFTRN